MMEQQALQHMLSTLGRICRDSASFDGTVTVDLGPGTFTTELSPERFSTLQPAPVGRAAAVDGSSCRVLDGLSFAVTMSRAAGVIADEDEVLDTITSDVQVTALSRGSLEETFSEAYRRLCDAPPAAIPETVEDAAGALRGLQEQAMARELIEQLDEGDLCMLDGALRGNRWLQPVVDETCELAAGRGVHIAAISKRSDLAGRGVPLLYWLARQGNTVVPEQRWLYPLCRERGIYVARLHPAAPYAFRVDVSLHDDRPVQVLRQLAVLSDDVATLGYPYPLAAVHRCVVLRRDEVGYWQRRLREGALDQGMSRDDWEGLFYDYHTYLE